MKYQSGHSELPVTFILTVAIIFIIAIVTVVIVLAKFIKWLF